MILEPSIKESIKSVIARYNAEEIIVKCGDVSKGCLKSLQDKVSKYGIVIEDFNLTDLKFSEEYTKAVEDKQVAEQALEKAKLDADAKIVEAEATKKANELLKQTLNDELLKKEFIEKWDGKLPDTYAGEDIFKIFGLN